MEYILGIETSCDDTCLALINEKGNILCDFIINQHNAHKIYNGIVPEIASRMHSNNLPLLLKKLLEKYDKNKISAVCATLGPGLIGGLITGAIFAQTTANILDIPFIPVNHLEAHVLSAKLNNKNISYPYLALLISGGHCQFVAALGLGEHVVLGNTLDDAIGETFDKLGSMLNMEYPGGPKIELSASKGNNEAYKFPMPLCQSKCANFSFSGLKTHLRNLLKSQNITAEIANNICASFQKTVLNILLYKINYAIQDFEVLKRQRNLHCTKNYLAIVGGVASNQYLKKNLEKDVLAKHNYSVAYPPKELCQDNAAMIAYTGMQYLRERRKPNSPIRSKWSLEQITTMPIS